MNITVIGTGYVGLVTGVCFASLGNEVTCVDIDAQKVARMITGEVPLYEPGLDDLFAKVIKDKRLSFTTDLSAAVPKAKAIFLALPTPPGEDGSADLSYVLGVADQLGPLLGDGTVVIDKSTVPVGTSEQVRARIAANTSVQFDVVSNPEFLREGVALADFMKPDRIVVGSSSERARRVMGELYEPIASHDRPLLFMDERSAELTKYAANSFLATKITFMNEIANLCERTGADVDSVRKGIGTDKRIGDRFLFAGIGYGGSCFPKDVLALRHTGREHGYDFNLLDAIITLNTKQQHRLQEKILHYYRNDVAGKTFALWGVAFKPGTDDVREAAALGIIRDLLAKGAAFRLFDPEALVTARTVLGDNPKLYYAADQYDALQGAEALIIATEWDEFRSAPLPRIKKELKNAVIFDGRNIYTIEKVRAAGFHYESIGRVTVESAATTSGSETPQAA